jgi:mannonate dehydratase
MNPISLKKEENMKIALVLPSIPNEKWILARQIGVNYAISGLGAGTGPVVFERLLRLKTCFADAGITLAGLEGDPINMQRIKLGLPGRDEDIERFQEVLRIMGALEIPMLCYNFMARIGWYRTSVTIPDRGGSLVSGFDYDLIKDAPPTDVGIITQEQMWDNLTYFLEAVVPTAEEAGVKLALHPDDPPIPSLRGIGRILINADAYRRALAISPSPYHGLTMCQGTFTTMGEDVRALVKEWRDKVFFVHLRDIAGTATNFRETWHDLGPTSMPEMIQLYHEIGFDGVMRPDHTPTLEGEDNARPGYEMMGRLFAVGYMKGIMEALGIPIE